MLKKMSATLISVSALMASTAFAAENLCTPGKVAGSFVRQNVTSQFIDAVTLGIDGTAYFHQSTQFDHIVTNGITAPMIGTWKCIDGNNLAMTVIATNYGSVQIEYPAGSGHFIADTSPISFERLSMQWKLLDKNVLQRSFFADSTFALTDDPLSPASVPLFHVLGTNQPLYNRVQVLTSDFVP